MRGMWGGVTWAAPRPRVAGQGSRPHRGVAHRSWWGGRPHADGGRGGLEHLPNPWRGFSTSGLIAPPSSRTESMFEVGTKKTKNDNPVHERKGLHATPRHDAIRDGATRPCMTRCSAIESEPRPITTTTTTTTTAAATTTTTTTITIIIIIISSSSSITILTISFIIVYIYIYTY